MESLLTKEVIMSTKLYTLALLHETKPPVADAVAMIADGTATKGKIRKIEAALSARKLRTLSPTGLKKGDYAVPEHLTATIGGSVITVGWYYKKPYIKVDGVKVPSGTPRFRCCWTAVTGGIALPVTAATVTVDDLSL